MGRIYETQNSAHASAVAKALNEAAGDDRTWQVATTTGQNGRVAFSVPDDFPDVDVPDAEAGAQGSDNAEGGALHPGVNRVLGDTQPDQLEPETGDEDDDSGGTSSRKRRGRRAAQQQQEEQQAEETTDDTQHRLP